MALSFSSPNLYNFITLFNKDVTGPRVEVCQSFFVLGSTPAGCQQVISGPNLRQRCSKSTDFTHSVTEETRIHCFLQHKCSL